MSKLEQYGFILDCKHRLIINHKQKFMKWFVVWRNMILRCYDINNKDYKYYGAKGVTVSDEFKLASSFRDWYLENNPNGDLVMDKDQSKKNIYSKESIVFISQIENIMEMRQRVSHKGKLNPKYKEIDYYRTHSSFRFNFKELCKKRNLEFDDFIEVFDSRVICNNGKPRNKYYYIYTK